MLRQRLSPAHPSSSIPCRSRKILPALDNVSRTVIRSIMHRGHQKSLRNEKPGLTRSHGGAGMPKRMKLGEDDESAQSPLSCSEASHIAVRLRKHMAEQNQSAPEIASPGTPERSSAFFQRPALSLRPGHRDSNTNQYHRLPPAAKSGAHP